jgi:4-amino-4-deoxy-L-arabinose transferase-like glycosyltransferase
MSQRLRPFLIPALAAALFLALTLRRLDTVPPLSDDEGWIASSADGLASRGVYGSELIAGFAGGERCTFHHMPLFPLLQAAVFRLAGFGPVALRIPSVLCGLAVLLLSWSVARRLAGGAACLLLLGLLLALRLFEGGAASGIPLVDAARVARYDVAVPAFGMAAFAVALAAESGAAWLVAGLLAGLATLGHLYGAFWLPALGCVAALRPGQGRLRHVALLAAGWLLACLPYLAYAAAHREETVAQLRLTQESFDLLDPSFYRANLVHEPERYRALDLRDEHGLWRRARPGAWLALLGTPIALAVLLFAARGPKEGEGRIAALVLLLQGTAFALLIHSKSAAYIVALWPLAALCLALAAVRLWHATRWGRGIVALGLALIVAESALHILRSEARAAQVLPYPALSARLSAAVPDGARVLGLPRFWPALHEHPFRSWVLPFYLSEPKWSSQPISFEAALEVVRPDVVLLDADMAAYFALRLDSPAAAADQAAALRSFFERHAATLAATVEAPGWGRIDVYSLRQPALQASR